MSDAEIPAFARFSIAPAASVALYCVRAPASSAASLSSLMEPRASSPDAATLLIAASNCANFATASPANAVMASPSAPMPFATVFSASFRCAAACCSAAAISRDAAIWRFATRRNSRSAAFAPALSKSVEMLTLTFEFATGHLLAFISATVRHREHSDPSPCAKRM